MIPMGIDNGSSPRDFGPARRSIHQARDDLSGSELKVADVLLSSGVALMTWSVTDVADAAGVAASTVVRACQRLGYRGFQDLKIAVAQDGAVRSSRLLDTVDGDGTVDDVFTKVMASGQEALRSAAETVDPALFERAVELVAAADQVLFVGVGTSSPLAQDAAYRFISIGIRAEAPVDVHMQHVRARLLGPGDVCVAISHTGATRETLATVQGAVASGASTVAVTSFLRSPITELVDVAMVAHSPEVSFRIEAMSSRIAHMSMLDALLIAVSTVNASASKAAQTVVAEIIAEHRY